jgi:hypothetical protein
VNAERSFAEGLRRWKTQDLKEALSYTISAAMGLEKDVLHVSGLSESQRAMLYAQELERRGSNE